MIPEGNRRFTHMLTHTKIKSLKPRDQVYRVADQAGLALEVRPAGTMYWRLRYRHDGRQLMLSLGRYPDISLAEARVRRDAEKAKLRDGVDPSAARREARRQKRNEAVGARATFGAVASSFLEREQARLAPRTVRKNLWLLEDCAIPALGDLPIREITPLDVLGALRRLEAAGKLPTATRVKQKISQVFRFAIIEGLAETDPTIALRGALAPQKVKHYPAITDPKKIGPLLRAIDGYEGDPITAAALRFLPLVFVRPGELRAAEWSEIDLARREWRIPAAKMKMRAAHLVPISRQAVAILRTLQPLSGSVGFVFPSVRSRSRRMSENTLNGALRRLGYTKEEMTSHGFRALASSRLNELGFRPDAIERQLAHSERNSVRAAYSHGAEYLEERREMMQKWADYLDQLKETSNG